MVEKNRILIVEDEAAIRIGLIDVFVFHGFDVDSALHGEEGLRKALSGLYDLILLDVMLPGVNGFDICNQIRQRDRQQPVIMLTAKTSDEDIVRGLTARCRRLRRQAVLGDATGIASSGCAAS